MITVILVGIDGWERYTKPAIDSIVKHEPNCVHGLYGEGDYKLTVMDNGHRYGEHCVSHLVPGEVIQFVQFVATMDIISYAAAINFAVDCSPGSDYYVILNNDILCTDRFVEQVESFPKDAIGANTINCRDNYGWIDGWHYCIPLQVWERVGPFDENFKAAAFEDADYTIRAQKLGIPIIQTKQPFKHLWAHNRYKVNKFWHLRELNKRYLISKHPEYKEVFSHYD